MSKREFLDSLCDALSYELPERLVESNLRYYSDYIDGEIQKGRTANEVLTELGDPRLIARSVIDAAKSGADGIPGTDDDLNFAGASAEESGSGAYRQSGNAYGSSLDDDPETGQDGFHEIRIHQIGCLGFVVIFAMLGLFLSLLGTIIGGALSLLSPVLGPVCLVLLIIWLLREIDQNR